MSAKVHDVRLTCLAHPMSELRSGQIGDRSALRALNKPMAYVCLPDYRPLSANSGH